MYEHINPPFNYMGSKFKLLDQIIPVFDYSKSVFIDLFCGGGSVGYNVLPFYQFVWFNDVIKDLIKVHHDLIYEENFVDKVKLLCVKKDDQAGYLELRKKYNSEKLPEQLYALILCCTNNFVRFNSGGGFNNTFGRRTFNVSTQHKIDLFKMYVRPYLSKMAFNSTDFNNIDCNDLMIYADPPYSNGCAGYNTTWKPADDKRLLDYLLRMSDKNSVAVSGLLSHNGIRSFLIDSLVESGKFKTIKLDCNYDGVARKKVDKQTQEVLLVNY